MDDYLKSVESSAQAINSGLGLGYQLSYENFSPGKGFGFSNGLVTDLKLWRLYLRVKELPQS